MNASDTAELAGGDERDTDLPKMGFLDHLEELRKRLVWSFVAVFVCFLVCWNYADRIYAILQAPLTNALAPGDKLAYTRLTAPFILYMKVAFLSGIFVAAPFILLQVWLFIAPGLYKKERRMALPFIIATSALFIIGGLFGWRFLLPAACKFFVETGRNFKQMITVDDYYSFASTILLASGLVFETPILIFFLARLGIVTPAYMMHQWKLAVVISFIVAAFITPTPDPFNQTLLAAPMIGLYFLGVLISYLFAKKIE